MSGFVDRLHDQDITREEFLKHAWDWKEKYGGIIIKQLKRLGCSCDWERERFTMDEGYTKAVLSAFVKLYEKGYIYKGFRLVNWCPVSKSAISDEEVIHKESMVENFGVPGNSPTILLPLLNFRP